MMNSEKNKIIYDRGLWFLFGMKCNENPQNEYAEGTL